MALNAEANNKEYLLAQKAKYELDQQNKKRQERVNELLEQLEAIKTGNVPIPIARVAPDKVEMASSALEAVDEAVSDEAYKNFVEQNQLALSTQLAQSGSDPRLRQFVNQKAVEQYRANDKQRATELAQDDQKALQFAATMEQDVNKTNAANKLAADRDYTQARNQFLQEQYANLTNAINAQYEAMYGLDYQAAIMPMQADVTSSARTANMVGDVTALGSNIAASGGFGDAISGEKGIKIPDYVGDMAKFSNTISELTAIDVDSFAEALKSMNSANPKTKDTKSKDEDKEDETDSSNDTTGEVNMPDDLGAMGLKILELGGRPGSGFAKENGGAAVMTEGEFNHGDFDKPETGNDQVLLDQEDLKKVMDEGGANNFDELMSVVKPQAILTGGELVFNDQDSGNIEALTRATGPVGTGSGMGMMQNEQALTDELDSYEQFRKGGKKSKKKTKKGKKEKRRAEAALAAYMRNLLGKEQFQG